METSKTFRKRNAILHCLRSTTSHPSAEALYQLLQKEHPKLRCKRTIRNLPNLTAKLSETPDITFADIPKQLDFIFPTQQFLYGRNCLAAIHGGF